MGPKNPRITGKALLSVLTKFGFETTRIKGSHHFLLHADGRSTVIPIHAGEIIGPGLLSKILRDCDITKDELIQRL